MFGNGAGIGMATIRPIPRIQKALIQAPAALVVEDHGLMAQYLAILCFVTVLVLIFGATGLVSAWPEQFQSYRLNTIYCGEKEKGI